MRQLKRDADSSKRSEGEETEPTVKTELILKERNILNEKEDDDDDYFEVISPVEK